MSAFPSGPTSTLRHPWLAVGATGLATFSVVTTEMLPVGLMAAKRPGMSLCMIALGLLLVPRLFIGIGQTPAGGSIALLAWGLAYGGVSVVLMSWMIKAAPAAVGIALGSWAGGRIVDGFALTPLLWLAAAVFTMALLLALGARQRIRAGASC
ncbi:MAG: hypothetical protein LBE53_11305 [Paucimonas sp.]|jgi:predicted MFS family arabinose efflux permease|nr:hypothetical protein [Paucimonas sp.]